MRKLSAIGEIRQLRAKRAYQDQKAKLLDAQAHLDKRTSELAQIEHEVHLLRDAAQQTTVEHNIRIQQSIQDKRHWLQYDHEKAQYFYDDASNDVLLENQTTKRCRTDWLKLQDKHRRYVENLKQLYAQRAASADGSEEAELADNLIATEVLRVD